jgi:YbbR domain-containing protein
MVTFLRGNLAWILLSILLSVGLWVTVTFQQNPEVTANINNVPVVVQGAPKTMYVQQQINSVQVLVSTPSDVLPQVTVQTFQAVADASKITPGVQSIPVKVTSLDPRARVLSWTPDKISLSVEPLATKTVPVQVIPQGSVPFQYDSGAIQTTPTQVAVSGPQSSVDQVTAAVVQVSLDGLTKTINQPYKPIPESADGTRVDQITVAPDQVLVQVPVEQKLATKTLPVQPQIAGNPALGYEVVGWNIDPEAVTLVGDPKTLNDMTFVPTQPIIVDGFSSDQEVPTSLNLPGTVALARAQPVVVRVLIASVDGSKTILVAPKVVNGAGGVVYSIDPGSVNVTVSGPIPILTHIGPTDLPVTVDAHGILTGTVTARATVTVPPVLKLVSVQPQTVTVAVK